MSELAAWLEGQTAREDRVERRAPLSCGAGAG